MIKIFKYLTFSLVGLTICNSIFAADIVGGNISYAYTGTANEYSVTLTLYRNCGGANLQNTQPILISNDCGEANPSLTLNRKEINEVSQICTTQLQNTECNGGNLKGVEEHIYNAVVALPAPCDAWTFSCQVGNRNTLTNILNSASTQFYIETKMYSSTDISNNSPTLNFQSTPYICTNQASNYDFSIKELDGDSLKCQFVSALGNSGSSLSYAQGFTSNQPIPGIQIDSETGLISFAQSSAGNYAIAIMVSEFDVCGNLISSMLHDVQVDVGQCTNQVPAIIGPSNIIQNFNNFGTNANISATNTINLCTNDKFCFEFQFSDPDMGDNVFLSSNATQLLPGATFIQTSLGNPSTGQICWEYVQGYEGSLISIHATDNVCPIPGSTDAIIKLDMPPTVFAGIDSTKNICGNIGTTDLFGYSSGRFQDNGQWFDPNDNPISNIVTNTSSLISGVYYYVVVPDTAGLLCGNPPHPCILPDTAFITINTSSPQFSAFWSPFSIVNETCDGSNDGEAEIGPITGNSGPFTVTWKSPYSGIHDTQTVANGSKASQTNLYQDLNGAEPWTVSITDNSNCSITQEFFIYHGNCLGIADETVTYSALFITHPNPVDQLLFIEVFDSSEKLVLSDIEGKIIKELQNLKKGNHVIDVSDLESGIYIVTVFSERSTSSQKIIKY